MRAATPLRLAIVLCATLAGRGSAAEEPPIPKEGSYSSTTISSCAAKALPLGKDRLQMTWDCLGAQLSDGGAGLLHSASIRCVGGLQAVGGEYQALSGACVFTRPDGDQAFYVETASGKLGAQSKGTGTFVGGTGKLAGLTGGGEFTRYIVRAAAEGTFQVVTHSKNVYRLP